MESVSATAKRDVGVLVRCGDGTETNPELAHTMVMNKDETETKNDFIIDFTFFTKTNFPSARFPSPFRDWARTTKGFSMLLLLLVQPTNQV